VSAWKPTLTGDGVRYLIDDHGRCDDSRVTLTVEVVTFDDQRTEVTCISARKSPWRKQWRGSR
jgi:hypothetical protein